MLKSNTKETIRVIPMPITGECRVICVHKHFKHKEIIIITGISEQDVDKLKKSQELNINRDNINFNIKPDNVICYGDIDFHEGSEDCEQLDTFNWLSDLGLQGVSIPSMYDYDKHECVTNRKCYLWTETFRNSTFCRYLHGCIGKPQFTLIFRRIL